MTNEELAVKARQGDQDAALQLWEQIRRFVWTMARRRLPGDGSTNRVDMDDLMQSGYLGMAAAVQSFDPDSGFSFISCLKNHVRTAFAEVLGTRGTRRDALLRAVSMDAPAGSGDSEDSFTISDTLADPASEEALDEAIDRIGQDQAFHTVMQCVAKLDPRESDTIRTLYVDGLTPREAAEAAGIAPESMWRRRKKAIQKLRQFKEVQKLGRELYADSRTNFYRHVGVRSFQSAGASAVELLVEKRDRLLIERVEQMRRDVAADLERYRRCLGQVQEQEAASSGSAL